MKATMVKNLQLTPEEAAVIGTLYDTIVYSLEEEDCDMGEVIYAIAHVQPKSGNITITYSDEKAE